MFILQDRHEASPELDVDWTLSEDLLKEYRVREVRSQLIKTQLLSGRQVCYRSSGWSLCPRVRSNDQTTYAPVNLNVDMVQVDDIVFCEVQTSNRFYAPLVKDKYLHRGVWTFIISNLQGHVHGWCRIEHIYGKLIECIH
jgi:hypothetical protein